MNPNPNPNLKLFPIFFEPDDAGGGGGGEAPESATADPWSGAEPEPQAQPTPSVAPAPVTIDPKAFEAFGKSFGETFAKHQQQTQQTAPPTPEQLAEARKALKFFEIDDNFVKEFGNIETQKASLERFRDGITQHIITVINHLRGNDQAAWKSQFDERFTPLQAMLEERANNERSERFAGRFPQFAAKEQAPYVNLAIQHLAQQRAFEGKSEAESFKLVADFLATQAKAHNPNFVLEDAGVAGGSPQPSRNGNSLPVTSPGSGASRGGQSGPSKKGWALAHIK